MVKTVLVQRILLALTLATALQACDSPSAHIDRLSFGETDVLSTTGNLRLITQRARLVDGTRTMVMCTEPSPDYAVAFGAKATANARVSITGSGEGEGGGTFERSEQITALEGRNAGVLALRDGLYTACQAYVNGVIGHDAYALILSQYGNLLVALAGAPASVTVSVPADATGKGAATAAAIAKAVATAGGAVRGNDAVAALLVTCLSTFDRSREPSVGNRLLTRDFCRQVLQSTLKKANRPI
ncbi:hypothetical protein FMGBMHLM_2341 [Methylobacterium aerolatum]|nr:hypothetical protein FMGBMHLM_2341 [Methylobacterium aerolatum]